jgi:quercetin dioxygenase-like cupin family protein
MTTSATQSTRLLLAVVAFAAAVASSGSSVLAQRDARGFVRVTPEQVTWVDDIDTNGLGVQRAVIQGDPSKPGLYVVRIRFPRGVMSRNHFHREDRHAVVLQGTWYTGTGDEFAPDKTIGLKPGSYMMHPAGEHHFDGAKEEDVILQLIGIGPSETTRLRPQDGLYGRSLAR